MHTNQPQPRSARRVAGRKPAHRTSAAQSGQQVAKKSRSTTSLTVVAALVLIGEVIGYAVGMAAIVLVAVLSDALLPVRLLAEEHGLLPLLAGTVVATLVALVLAKAVAGWRAAKGEQQ